ncbi:amino acid adenylation domain-containing protein [Calothrix sp. FACHB-1219]|uniref:amino acid adenylation domain-containing protein n=1 Tax=unclassified Calothrix TaxID=2619626 RepID=UPI0016840D80|nr:MULTISPECIES: non-ribosomal peptide synthetase [unclassified Calothrix]MBD2201082.1 amino acid adenylation domain-containing protein [Calothrix sp. FACHB-168]MBD2215515.1 amino acid adenylation domain-containing protein [Calothrix sp. FACHB-1219]
MKVVTREYSYQLSSLQQGMLFNNLVAQKSGVDIEQMICLVHEKIDVLAFQKAWQKVVERHAVLRTSFDWQSQREPQQYVHQKVIIPLEQQDWCDLSDTEQSTKLQAYLQSDRTLGFELNVAPLMRLALFRLRESVYQFIWTFHHALLDGRSLSILIKEVFAFYDAFCEGKDLQLPQPRPYQDHITWLQQQDWCKSESFWRNLLKGFTAPTPLLLDSNPRDQSGFGEQAIRLSEKTTAMLQSLAQQHQLTINTLVQGAWAILLSRYSGESDIVFGATRACRHSSVAGAESIVGLLINTLPVRVSVSGEKSLLSWLKELRSQWVALRNYEHTPLVNVQRWSDVPPGKPLFDSILVFENYELNSALRSQGGRWQNLEFRLEEQTNFPLTLVGYADSELLLKLKYDQNLFDNAKIARMLGHLETLLSSMANNPWQCLGELPLLTSDEKHQMLIEWNHTQADFAEQLCIHQLFEAQVEQTPDAVAVVCGEEQLTYQQLNCRANQLAHHLKQLGVKPGVLVAVYLERSLEMIPTVLGILKAGGAYVPLEPSFPKARIQLLLSSLEINSLVTQSWLLPNIHELELVALQHLICLDKSAHTQSGWQVGHQQVWNRSYLDLLPTENLPTSANSNDIAYVIFTSGSTGTPKGVVVRHRPVINLIEWVNKTFNINSADRVLFITSLCFDLSVYDIFGLLAAGGSIRVVPSDDVRDPEALLHILCHEPITFWDSAPPALQQLAGFFSQVQESNCHPQLRLVFMSGDWIPVTLPDLLKATFPGVEVISLGGATEATVWSNYYPIGKVEPYWKSIPYGKPIQNAKYYILDDYLNPCPIGVSGELHIGGECLASGYLNQPELTAQKFIPDPFSDKKSARLYKTGDLARYLADGNIEFLGRIDHQVKIRGFRIELGEIESVLSQHDCVQETVVIAREDEPGNKRLVAYVVLNGESTPTMNELRRFLREKLPDYMIPSAFVAIAKIPLTPNGKVDRRALPIPDQNRPELEKAFVSPKNTVEIELTQIWSAILGIKSIGISDNFFDLGGDSLLAVKLFTQIEKKFGQKLPLATLLQSPTIEQLASILRQSNTPASWSSLVTIQPGSSEKRPLFLIHALGGNVIGYQTLVRYLGKEQPVYGLQAQGLDGKQTPHTRVEDMASHYIKEMRTVQPHGPYLLGGFSSGGTIAFEMARQLVAQGDRVALLAMFDTYSPSLYINNPSLLRTLYVYFLTFWRLRSTDRWNYFLAKLDWLRSMLTGKPSSKFDLWNEHSFTEDANPYNMALIEALKQATMADYIPQPYAGKVTLFTTNEVLRWCQFKPCRGWKGMAKQGVEIHEVPGTHLGMLGEPTVQILAEKLIVCLEQAQADNQVVSSFTFN